MTSMLSLMGKPPSPPPFPGGFKWDFCEIQSDVSLINETILAA